ncbi:MAG: hypothetical protein ABIJ03_01795 [Patescibacteria group bacterium]|nr:pilin [Patescibacteria group bacterium]
MPQTTLQLAQFGDQGLMPPVVNDYTRGVAEGETAFSSLELIISNVIGLLTTIGAIMFILYFILGAISWIGSGGDKGKLESARNQMMHGALGLIIIVSAYAIIGLIGRVVGLDILSLADQLKKLTPN